MGFIVEHKNKSFRSNNTKGVIPLPTYDTDPINQKKRINGKINFGALYGRGESPREDGLFNFRTSNGIARGQGQGDNQQYNWCDGVDGDWNRNNDWSGGNRTGE